MVGSSGDNDCHPDGLPAFQKPSTFGKIQADFQLLIWKGEKRWYPLVKSSHIFYYSNLFHSFIHCLVSTRRWRVGWILKQRGKSENELQRWTIQGMLPCAKSPDDMWESSGSIAELEFDEDIIHRTIVVQYFNCSLLVEHPAVNHDCNTPNSTLPLHQTMHILHKTGCHQIKK